MKNSGWLIRYFLFSAITIGVFFFPIYSLLLFDVIEGQFVEIYRDETIVSLPKSIMDVQDAYVFANDRISELGIYDAKLTSIEVSFSNKTEVKEQRGSLQYRYTINIDGRRTRLARGKIAFDMKQNTNTSFDVYMDTRGGGIRLEHWHDITPLDFSKWTLTLVDVFEIIYEELGTDIVTGIRVRCGSDYWLINVSYLDAVNNFSMSNFSISIDPITRELLDS